MKPEFTLQANEKLILEAQPEKIYIYYNALRLFKNILFGVLVLVIIIFYHNNMPINFHLGAIWNPRHVSIVLSILVAALLFVLISSLYWSNLVYQNSRFFLTDKRIVIYSGVLNVKIEAYTYSRIVDVDYKRNFLQSLFALATIKFKTQGFSGENLYGLSSSNAAKIYQIISEHLTRT
jgi:uncharacterized membrane protein YdbT with pleckstrin-like domain